MVEMAGQTSRRMSWTNPIWEQIRDRGDLFAGSFAWSSTRFNLAAGGQSELVDGLWASGGYFDVLGVRPLLGRVFTRDDDRRGPGHVQPVLDVGLALVAVERREAGAVQHRLLRRLRQCRRTVGWRLRRQQHLYQRPAGAIE
jgi:hypothetical protein